MENLRALRPAWIELPLNTTFRCPRLVVERQHAHAPHYVAASTNPQGAVHDLTTKGDWNWKTIHDLSPLGETAVLCRNNAPLVSLAFKLIAGGIGVNMLGRDIGRGLSTLCKKLSPDLSAPLSTFLPLLAAWREAEISKAEANENATKAASVADKADCILAVAHSGQNIKTLDHLIKAMDALFARTDGLITLATGHKAKGLEWDNVVHLDPWRIPSKYAKKDDEIRQEYNLRYVLETRTKHTLILANLSDFGA